jgi:K+-transporting ATPase A subunit
MAFMGILFLTGVFTVYATESGGNPAFASLPIDAAPSKLQAGGNMEGKEVRFGIANSMMLTSPQPIASWAAADEGAGSTLPRRPKVSATGNNGSAFAGLSANTPFWNTTLGLAMWIGRFLVIVPMLAIAGSLASKKLVPASAGTFPTDGGLFVGLLIGVILIIGGLIYFPALALGPIEEHLAMRAGSLF